MTEQRVSRRAVAGFACNQGFVFSLFYMGSNQAVGSYPFAFERAELFGTLVFIVAAFCVLRAVGPRARRALLARPLLWCYAALLVIGSFVPAVYGVGAGGLVFECALIGLPAGLMLAAWGRALGARALSGYAPTVLGGSAAGAAVCFLCAVLPLPQAVLALNLLPLGSAWALRSLMREAEAALGEGGGEEGKGAASAQVEAARSGMLRATAQASPESRSADAGANAGEARRLSAQMIAGTVLFGVAAGFMETYGSDPGMASNPAFPMTLLIFVLFCTAAFQLIRSQGDAAENGQDAASGQLVGVYRSAMLVMMAGFLFVPVLGDFGVPGEAIVLAGYLGLTAVLAVLFLSVAHLSHTDPALFFAKGFTALYAGELGGLLLGNLLDAVEPSGVLPYASVACAGLAALYAFLFLFTERDFSALCAIVRVADRFGDACALLARECGLSKRESDVLPLALKGRTNERIAAELCVSKSTVDTHLRRIYAKCGVHSRQELIDLGERTAQRLAQAG